MKKKYFLRQGNTCKKSGMHDSVTELNTDVFFHLLFEAKDS